MALGASIAAVPHVVASGVFTDDFYAELAIDLTQVMEAGAVPSADPSESASS